jgi:hypothetical protein
MKLALPKVARVFVAAYVGALIAGPAPYGFVGLVIDPFGNTHPMAIVALVLQVLVVPWLITGILAGSRLGAFAGALGILLFGQSLLLEPLFSAAYAGHAEVIMETVGIVCIGATSGWLGGYLELRIGLEAKLDNWCLWDVTGALVFALFTYTVTLGPSVAVRALEHSFPKGWPVEPRATGVYLSADAHTSHSDLGGFSYTYYTDPTGLVVLFREVCVD